MTKLYLENILNVYLETSLKLHLELLSAAAQPRHGVLRGHREWALTVAQEDGGKHSELTLTYVGH